VGAPPVSAPLRLGLLGYGTVGRALARLLADEAPRLEALLGEKVYLETWVKVLPKWRRSPTALTRFGFPVPDPEIR